MRKDPTSQSEYKNDGAEKRDNSGFLTIPLSRTMHISSENICELAVELTPQLGVRGLVY